MDSEKAADQQAPNAAEEETGSQTRLQPDDRSTDKKGDNATDETRDADTSDRETK